MRSARTLLRQVSQSKRYPFQMQTGGFEAHAYSKSELALKFVVAEWDSCED